MPDIVYLMNVDDAPIDGKTLLNTREMSDHILDWVQKKVVYLTSEDTIERLVNRVPGHLMRRTAGAFTSGGSEFWMHGERVWVHPHEFPVEMTGDIKQLIRERFPEFNDSIEFVSRPGLINVSLIGRNASLVARKEFGTKDHKNSVRVQIEQLLDGRFPQYKTRIAGEVSVDIFPREGHYDAIRQFVAERHRGASIGHLHAFI